MDTSPNDPIHDTQDQIEKKSDNGESGNASPPRGKEGVPKKSSMEAQIEKEIAEKCMAMEKEIADKYPRQSKDIANVSPMVSKRQEKEKSAHNGNDKLKENTDSCSKDKLRKEKEDVFAIKGPGGKNLLVTKIPIPTSDSAKQTVNPIQKSSSTNKRCLDQMSEFEKNPKHPKILLLDSKMTSDIRKFNCKQCSFTSS